MPRRAPRSPHPSRPMLPAERVAFLVQLAGVTVEMLRQDPRKRAAILRGLTHYLDSLHGDPAKDWPTITEPEHLEPTLTAVRALIQAAARREPFTYTMPEMQVQVDTQRNGIARVSRQVTDESLPAPLALRAAVLDHASEDLRTGGLWVFAKPATTHRVRVCALPTCDVVFYAQDARQVYCSREHQNQVALAQYRKKHPRRKRKKKALAS